MGQRLPDSFAGAKIAAGERLKRLNWNEILA
jgi:hypothetical protein